MTRLAVQLNASDESLTAAVVSTASMGSSALVAAKTGAIIRVYKLWLVAAGAVTIEFLDASTALSGVASLVTGVPLVLGFDTKPWLVTGVGDALNISLGGAVQISGVLYYVQSQA